MVTLHTDGKFLSPFSFIAYVALKEKGVAFEQRQWGLRAGEHLVPEFQQLSITGKVPCLVDGDFALAESQAIIEYIEETWQGPEWPRLLPRDLRPRARCRQVLSWLRTDLFKLKAERSARSVFLPETAAPLSNAARDEAARLLAVSSALLAPEQEFLFGAWSIADLDLAFTLGRLVKSGDDVPARLRSYCITQLQRPAPASWFDACRKLHHPQS